MERGVAQGVEERGFADVGHADDEQAGAEEWGGDGFCVVSAEGEDVLDCAGGGCGYEEGWCGVEPF